MIDSADAQISTPQEGVAGARYTRPSTVPSLRAAPDSRRPAPAVTA